MVGRVCTEDCRVDWSRPAAEVRNLVRACTPWPGAWCMWGERRLRLERVDFVQKDLTQAGEPGQVVEIADHDGPVVRTGEDCLVVRQLQPAGKRSMSGAEFLRGARMCVGERLN